ncbi:MAG: hypothetical protein J6334_13765 [Kiritimatiellae bacterium]|nr:hypothetical protein [Kiritimatiellia bacterium]
MGERLSGVEGGERQWWVRIGRDACFGPVPFATLQTWAREGRIDPNSEVSSDYRRWIPAISVEALEMVWIASLPDGRFYGPIHREALAELLANGGLPADAMVFRRSRPDTEEEASREGLLEKIRQWSDANAMLQAQIERERREANADLVQSQQACRTAESRCAVLEEEVVRLQEDASVSQGRVERLQTLLEEARRESAALAERCERLRRSAEEAEEKYRLKCEEAAQSLFVCEVEEPPRRGTAGAGRVRTEPVSGGAVTPPVIEPEVVRPEPQPLAGAQDGPSALAALERQLQWELSQLGDNAPKVFGGKEPAFLKAFAFLKRPSFLKLPAFLKRG